MVGRRSSTIIEPGLRSVTVILPDGASVTASAVSSILV